MYTSPTFPSLRTLFLAFAFATACLFLPMSPAGAVDQSFQVVDVAPTDVLNVRATPHSTAVKLTSLPFDATHIDATGKTQMVGDASWVEIHVGTQTGWVNAHFLSPMGTAEEQPISLFQEPLSCSGTEPFWGLQIKDRIGELDSISDDHSTILFRTSRQPGGIPIIWSLRGHTKSSQSSVIAILEETNQCSDGMSNLLYRYSIRLDVADGPFFAGCCNRLPGQPDP